MKSPRNLIARIRREAAARGIEIASLQGTFNMSHPDAEHRRAGVRRLGVLAAACRQLGTSKIHICTGTRDRENMWRRHPDNDSPEAWRDMVACVRAAADIAKPVGVILAFEPEVNNVVDSAKKARRLLDEIGSPHLKVTMDAANLFHAGELAHMSEVLDQAFALVGKDIVMAHAKDLSHDGDAGHEPAGHGQARLRSLSFPAARLRVQGAALAARTERGAGARLRGLSAREACSGGGGKSEKGMSPIIDTRHSSPRRWLLAPRVPKRCPDGV